MNVGSRHPPLEKCTPRRHSPWSGQVHTQEALPLVWTSAGSVSVPLYPQIYLLLPATLNFWNHLDCVAVRSPPSLATAAGLDSGNGSGGAIPARWTRVFCTARQADTCPPPFRPV